MRTHTQQPQTHKSRHTPQEQTCTNKSMSISRAEIDVSFAPVHKSSSQAANSTMKSKSCQPSTKPLVVMDIVSTLLPCASTAPRLLTAGTRASCRDVVARI